MPEMHPSASVVRPAGLMPSQLVKLKAYLRVGIGCTPSLCLMHCSRDREDAHRTISSMCLLQ